MVSTIVRSASRCAFVCALWTTARSFPVVVHVPARPTTTTTTRDAFVVSSATSARRRRPVVPGRRDAASASSLLPTTAAAAADPSSWCLAGGVASLVGYHVVLFRAERRGAASWRKAQADVREAWSRRVRADEAWLYAVQTLRNAITANTFLATTVLSLLTVIGGRAHDSLRAAAATTTRTRLAALAACMLSSAYHFLQSARLMTHAGFMFPVLETRGEGTKVDRILRESENAQWIGLRWLYCSVSAVAWVVGGERLFLTSAVGSLVFFRAVDAAPRDN